MPRYLLWSLIGFVIAAHLCAALGERDGIGFVAVLVALAVDVCVPLWEGAHKGEPDRADVLFLVW